MKELPPLRAFMLPAVILAIALAIVGRKLYDHFSRPSAPASVQRVIAQYTNPAIKVGGDVRDAKAVLHVPLAYVRGIGYVAHPADATGISEIRLYLSERDRAKQTKAGNDDRIDAIELLSIGAKAYQTLVAQMTQTFRSVPKRGCLVLGEEGNYREVHYWMARDGRGGVAITNDYGANESNAHPGTVTVGLLAFAGAFDSSRTMRGDYLSTDCAHASARTIAEMRKAVNPAARLTDSLTLAFADLATGAAPPRPARPTLYGADTLDACVDNVAGNDFKLEQTRLFDVRLPADFKAIVRANSDRDAARLGTASYLWTGADHSTVKVYPGTAENHSGFGGQIFSECSTSASGAQLHIDLVNASVNGPDHGVYALFLFPDRPALRFEAHARSLERQAALLHSVRTLFIAAMWGVRP